MGASIEIKVPLDWEGEPTIARHISGWRDMGGWSTPIHGGDEYVTRTTRFQAEGFDDLYLEQPEGWEALLLSWNGELNYGWDGADEGCALLDWLVAHRVPFLAQTDGKYEMDGAATFYDGNDAGQTIDRPWTNAGFVLTRQDWLTMNARCAHLDDSKVFEALCEAVDEHLRPFDLASCDVSHLPADPPTDEEEA